MSDALQGSLVVKHACRLFLEYGYGGTTMSDIAVACHVSKRTLYRLFPSKTDLFAAIIDRHRSSMLALPGDYDDVSLQQALERILQVGIGEQADRERRALLRLFLVEARRFPELGELMRDQGAGKSRMLLAAWFEEQKARGRVEMEKPEAAAAMLMDMLYGATALKSGDGPEWPGGEDRDAYLRHGIQIFVNGIRPRPE